MLTFHNHLLYKLCPLTFPQKPYALQKWDKTIFMILPKKKSQFPAWNSWKSTKKNSILPGFYYAHNFRHTSCLDPDFKTTWRIWSPDCIINDNRFLKRCHKNKICEIMGFNEIFTNSMMKNTRLPIISILLQFGGKIFRARKKSRPVVRDK